MSTHEIQLPRKWWRDYDLPEVRAAFAGYLRQSCDAQLVEWLQRENVATLVGARDPHEEPLATWASGRQEWCTPRWRAFQAAWAMRSGIERPTR